VGGGESFRFLLDFFHPFLFVACPQAASSAANIILWDASWGGGVAGCLTALIENKMRNFLIDFFNYSLILL